MLLFCKRRQSTGAHLQRHLALPLLVWTPIISLNKELPGALPTVAMHDGLEVMSHLAGLHRTAPVYASSWTLSRAILSRAITARTH
jgi:hypothetical protein